MPAPYLRLVAIAPSEGLADSGLLFQNYVHLKEVWHRTKIEANRQRAIRAYNAWIIATFPAREDQAPLLLSATSTWGFN